MGLCVCVRACVRARARVCDTCIHVCVCLCACMRTCVCVRANCLLTGVVSSPASDGAGHVLERLGLVRQAGWPHVAGIEGHVGRGDPQHGQIVPQVLEHKAVLTATRIERCTGVMCIICCWWNLLLLL